MKRAVALLLVCVLLSGCFGAAREIERGLELRSKILQAEQCSFEATVTADYGDKIYTFVMECQGNAGGDVAFRVEKPETISDISGKISGSGGSFTFDDTALCFPLMADDLLTPVSAPWIMLKTLRSGNITSAAVEGEMLHLSMDDSFADDALHLDIWLNSEDAPVRGDILWAGRRILTIDVANFEIQ